jgi:hypothetical protein
VDHTHDDRGHVVTSGGFRFRKGDAYEVEIVDYHKG